MIRRVRPAWRGVMAVGAGVACCLGAPLAAQPPRVVTMTLTAAPVFPSATAAAYGTGATPGQLLNVTGRGVGVTLRAQPAARTLSLQVRRTAATVTGPWAKPVGDVRACWSAACTYVPLSTVFQSLGTVLVPANRPTAGALAAREVWFRIALRWEQDRPGVYTVPVDVQLTVTRP